MEEALKEHTKRVDEASQSTSEPLGLQAAASASSTFITGTAQFVWYHPLGAVLAAAFGSGLLIGWLIAPDLKARLYSRGEQRQLKAGEIKSYKRAISRWEGEGGAIPSIKEGSKK